MFVAGGWGGRRGMNSVSDVLSAETQEAVGPGLSLGSVPTGSWAEASLHSAMKGPSQCSRSAA